MIDLLSGEVIVSCPDEFKLSAVTERAKKGIALMDTAPDFLGLLETSCHKMLISKYGLTHKVQLSILPQVIKAQNYQ
jgi:hypothetical protein